MVIGKRICKGTTVRAKHHGCALPICGNNVIKFYNSITFRA